MIWMKLRESPAKENGVYRMKDADLTSLPLLALQGLYAPTVFYAFIFFSRLRKEKNHKHSICLHVDMSPLRRVFCKSLEHTPFHSLYFFE